MENRGFTEHFTHTLQELEAQGNYRELRTLLCSDTTVEYQGKRYVNLASNDYLGLSGRRDLERDFLQAVVDRLDCSAFVLSNPSSRLITGNSPHYEQLEATIARGMGTEAALVLGSGYLTGVGIFGALTTKDDVILADKLVHSSLIDGMRLSEATLVRFRHNDMNHLETLLRKYEGQRVIVVTESLFSMDGDFAPLSDIARLQQQYDFMLYLDEAHSFGAMGRNGWGVARDVEGLRVDLHVATLGKAMASQGAFVACSEQIRQMLINRMRSLIFSTALPPISLMWSDYLIGKLGEFDAQRAHLAELVRLMEARSYIVPIMAYTNQRALEISRTMLEHGFWATAIRHPTVPQGQSRIRVSLSAALSTETIVRFKALCNTLG